VGRVGLFEAWKHRRRREKLLRALRAARRSGAGVYVHEWHAHETGASPAEAIVAWCRETLAHCRRPWGIAHFDLALGLSGGDGLPARIARYSRLEPGALYAAGGLESLLQPLFAGAEGGDGGVRHVVVALFSWGDAAAEALPGTG
jgi:hypothetical protein